MKKSLQALALGLILCMTAVLFAGCAKDETPSATATTVVEATATVAPKVITMGTNAAFSPFEYTKTVDGATEVVGVDADIAKEIASRLGYELVIKNMEFDSLITALNANQIDFIAAGMTITPEREEKVVFTDQYFKASQSIIVKEDSTIATKDDLIGKKIGVQLGTTGDLYIAQEITDVQLSQFPTGAEAVLALNNGTVDAVIIDNYPADKFVESNEGLKTIKGQYEDEFYAIAFRKADTALYTEFNTELKKMIEDGTINQYVIDHS